MTLDHFVAALEEIDFASTFNPYSDRCVVYDYHDSPQRRSGALLTLLKVAARSEIDSLWIGRDLGHRGGRRTGLALTDDVHLFAHAERWGVSIEKPTKGEVVAERTAAVIWSVLNRIDAAIFLWNVFPLHPHEPSDPFTNRAHNARERQVGEDLLDQLIRLLKPRRLLPIGNNAASAVNRVRGDQDIFRIRHPSYGGQNVFLKQTCELYGLHGDEALV